MAINNKPIVFTITDTGRLAVLDAQKQGLTLSLKTLVVGTSQYTPTGKETSIKKEVARTPIVSSGVEKQSKTLRFSASINSQNLINVSEVGLLTSDNKLFAIAASNSQMFTVYPNVTFVGSFGLSLDNLDTSNITVSIDANGDIGLRVMEDHLAATNPHPQYATSKDLSDLSGKYNSLNGLVTNTGNNLQAHITAQNPHNQYVLKTEHDAHVRAYDALKKVVDGHTKDISDQKKALSDHAAAPNPHSQYLLQTEFTKHLEAADPHSQYLQSEDLNNINNDIAKMKQDILDALAKITELPIGAVFTTTLNYKTGAEVTKALGYGTWQRIAEGRALVGISTKAADPAWTKTMKTTYGEYEHTLTLEEMPKHKHGTFPFDKFAARALDANLETKDGGDYRKKDEEVAVGDFNDTDWQKATEKERGSSKPHNNVQPSVVLGFWERVA